MKKSYRQWLGEFKLQNNKVTEEVAVKKITEIVEKFTRKQIDGAYRRTGLALFNSAELPDEDITDNEIVDELNQKLEEIQLFQ